jgi:uncharacterized damage-inducible protein DinB
MNKETLLKQFTNCYDKNGWFVALRNALKGVTAEQAVWKATGADNSIWETLAHVSYYNNAYLQRFKGIDYEYATADNDETFEGAENASEENWRAHVAKFDSIMTAFRDLLTAAEEAKFDQPVPQKTERKWAELIADINAHNAYHGGQILLLRKLQGSWNPEQGVS